MGFRWTRESIKWYLAAEKSTKFYKDIARLIEPALKGVSSVLDIGCGVGSLALEIGRKGVQVTAIDVSPLAVSVLKDRATEEGLDNIKALNHSLEEVDNGQKYDMVVLCYVMGLLEEYSLKKILNHARKYAVIVVPAGEVKDDFSVQSLAGKVNVKEHNFKQKCYKDVLPLLDKMNLHYSVRMVEEEFGQPFDSIQEAKDFFEHYFPVLGEEKEELESWLEQVMRHQGRGYYLPSTRKSVVIIISMEGVNCNLC